MRIWRRVHRIVVVVCTVACVLFLLTFALVQVGQHVLRRRAERLVSELKQLRVGESTWPDLQRLMTEWGAFGHYDGSCKEQRCEYEINLEDPVGDAARWASQWRFIMIPALPCLLPTHWHGASLSATISLKTGQVTAFSADFMTDVFGFIGPNKKFEEYALWATARSSERPDEYFVWPTTNPHPAFGVTQTHCMECLPIRVTFTPLVTQSEMNALMSFNLDCISRWKPCTTLEDVYPFAARQLEVDSESRRSNFERSGRCDFKVDEMVRGSESVMRVILTTDQARGAEPGRWQMYQAKVLETMKGNTPWKAAQSIWKPNGLIARQFFLLSPKGLSFLFSTLINIPTRQMYYQRIAERLWPHPIRWREREGLLQQAHRSSRKRFTPFFITVEQRDSIYRAFSALGLFRFGT